MSVGVLGADRTVEGARYRFARILKGENWNPKLQAPLTGPGVNVKEGDFLLAVNGQELSGADTLERLFLGLAGKQTVLTVGPSTLRSASHDVTVVPVASERNLRLRTWMEENRKKVADLSSGRVGYVYVPIRAPVGSQTSTATTSRRARRTRRSSTNDSTTAA